NDPESGPLGWASVVCLAVLENRARRRAESWYLQLEGGGRMKMGFEAVTRGSWPGRSGRLAGVVVLSAALLFAGTGALSPGVARAAAGAPAFTCSGGTLGAPQLIPSGTYRSVTVADGFCVMQGTYNIMGSLTVGAGAFLDAAVFFGFPPYDYGAPCNVFVKVSGGVRVGQGGALYFGNGAG